MESANSDTEPMCRATENSTKKYEKLASATKMTARGAVGLGSYRFAIGRS